MSNRLYFKTIIFILLTTWSCSTEENNQKSIEIKESINSILLADTDFNGVVLITQNDKVLFEKAIGYSSMAYKTPLEMTDEFVIGSISKQITAVLVLKEIEAGRLDLNIPVAKYLEYTDYNFPWGDSVTIHHLLSHTHGIREQGGPLSFVPGTQFQYSQIGYEILAEIIESVNEKSFAEISMAFFENHGLKNTYHVYIQKPENLVKGYVEENEQLVFETNSLGNYVPAGSFISNAYDLKLWNQLLFSGKLLKSASLEMMMKRYATRLHPIYGEVEYGYGLLYKKGEVNIQIGALGYAPGFVSASYFFPEKNINVIVLENVARDLNDFKKTFAVHMDILKTIKNSK
ncbi:MAG: serine hydrolase domain-containing protein [Saprospiraceae bacterium]